MRHLIAWLVDGLPLDARSRRAIDETLLDWAHEAAMAGTSLSRGGVALRATLAVLRAGVLVMRVECVHAPWAWAVARCTIVFGVATMSMMLRSYATMSDVRATASGLEGFGLAGTWAIHEIALLVPALVFVAFAWPAQRPRMPGLALVIAASLAAFLAVAVLDSLAGDVFIHIANPARRAAGLTAYSYGWGPPSLVWGLSLLPGRLFFGPFAFQISVSVLAGALVMLASALQHVGRGRARFWCVLVAVSYFGALQCITAGYLHSYYPRLDSSLGRVSLVMFAGMAVVAWIRAALRRPLLWGLPIAVAVVRLVILPDDWLLLYRVLGSGLAPSALAIVVALVAGRLVRSARSIPRSNPSCLPVLHV